LSAIVDIFFLMYDSNFNIKRLINFTARLSSLKRNCVSSAIIWSLSRSPRKR